MDRMFLAVIVSALLLLTGALGLALRGYGGSDISAKHSLIAPPSRCLRFMILRRLV
ncbi:hypothetical protein ABIF63_003554 [Bradyrhizobium japonicum]|uniref:Uncharacterized protein n=1 Tax=Bradyrhizobium japonicum TaxID=375 RepID=A0ABV2RR85_BRAJP